MLKLENIMQLFSVFKIIFFININLFFLKKSLIFIRLKPKRKDLKVLSTIFILTRNKKFLKFYIIKRGYNFKKFINKRSFKSMLFRYKKKYMRKYVKKIIKLLFFKMLIINKGRLNLKFFIKLKKISINNIVKKKFYKFFYKRKVRNTLAWFYFAFVRKLFKKKRWNVKFFVLFNKSHSKMNEKSKKLRRK